MPTYTVTTANLSLTPDQKSRIARAITVAHSDNTGAPSFFAQVRFLTIAHGDHFIGGRLNDAPHLFVSGLIRAGRNASVKQAVMNQMLGQIVEIAKIDSEDVWVYLQDVAPEQMIEFGRFLPEPGEEAAWEKGLSTRKRQQLSG